MITLGWRAWAVALAASFLVHGALTLNLRQPTPGVKEKSAGTHMSISGSLASILGAQQSEPVTTTDASPTEVAPTAVNETKAAPTSEQTLTPTYAATKSEELQPLQSTPPAEVPTSEPINVAPVAARSSSDAPLVPTVIPEPEEVTPAVVAPTKSTETKAAEATKQTRRAAEQRKAIAQKKRVKEAQRRADQQRRERAEKRRKLEERRRKARAKKITERRKAAAQAKAGSNRRGNAGNARGGKGGTSKVSTGSINRYGSRVRARILANRPSTTGSGRTVVSFALSNTGRLRYARVSRSSGNARLDRAALAAVRRSSPFPRPPKRASPRQLRFSISFSFR